MVAGFVCTRLYCSMQQLSATLATFDAISTLNGSKAIGETSSNALLLFPIPCTPLGEEHEIQEKAGYPAIDPLHTEVFAIGVDPGWGHSKFGLSMVYLYNDKLHVAVAQEHYQPDEDEMLDKILRLYERTQQPNKTKIFVDASAVPFIRRLKACFPNERTDYEAYQDELRKRGLLTASKDEAEMVHYMKVIPVPFNKYGQKMLASLYAFLQRGDLAIHPKFHSLISALQSARNMPGRTSQFILDKQTQSLDCLDALRLALYNFDADVPKFEQEEEEGEVEGEITTSS